MAIIRRLVCLANSRKGNGFCFAGLDPETLEWVRPIGSGWDGAVKANEQRCADGSEPELLDLIEVPLLRHVPEPGQPENWSLAPESWKRSGRLDDEEARGLLDELATDEPLFGNLGKALTPDEMAALDHSLAIVNPESMAWRRVGSKRLYAVFTHCGRELELSISDPVCFDEFKAKPTGDYEWRTDSLNFLTVSVTVHPWNGFHWKLVAAAIELPAT